MKIEAYEYHDASYMQRAIRSLKTTLTYLCVSMIFFQLFFGVYEIVSENVFQKREVYGPYPVSFETPNSFDFESFNFKKTRSFLGRVNLRYLSAIEKETLIDSLVLEIPKKLRHSAKEYMRPAFRYSESFNVDPLWILSVLWTESHFKPLATSHVKATGLMQIMPMTGVYLNELLKRPSEKKLVLEMLKDPETNIELGAFYLMRLYKRFKSHRYATVAYNMGPRFVSRRIKTGGQIGVKNDYYSKVKKRYNFLKRAIIKLQKQSRLEAVSSYIWKRQYKVNLSHYIGSDIQLRPLPKIAQR